MQLQAATVLGPLRLRYPIIIVFIALLIPHAPYCCHDQYNCQHYEQASHELSGEPSQVPAFVFPITYGDLVDASANDNQGQEYFHPRGFEHGRDLPVVG